MIVINHQQIKCLQALATSQIPLALARSVLSHHGLSDPSTCLDSAELRDLLRELYTRARRAAGQPAHHHGGEDGEALASLVEQLLDPGHQGGINVLGLKTVLAVVTGARLRDRLSFLFREHADHQVETENLRMKSHNLSFTRPNSPQPPSPTSCPCCAGSRSCWARASCLEVP